MRIKQNGQWMQAFAVGKDGITPHIGENGNWWFGEKDSGVAASYSGPVLPAGILEDGEYTNWTKLDDEYYIEKSFFGVNDSLTAIVITEELEITHTECIDGKLQIFVSVPPSKDIPFTVVFMDKKDILEKIEITESTDGSVTIKNKLKIFGEEIINIGADANGNPNSLTYNGTAIPIEWVVSA